MKAICLIDTSVFVNILKVPGKSQDAANIFSEMEQKIRDGESMFLPIATLLETGNHIGQSENGDQRRRCAKRFVEQLQLALAGESPFTPIDFVEADKMQQWVNEFPDWVAQRSGLGDLSIVHDFKRLREKNKGRRVYIWSLDAHLSAYVHEPEIQV